MEVKCECSKDKFGLKYLSKDINKTEADVIVGPSVLVSDEECWIDRKHGVRFSEEAPSLHSLMSVCSNTWSAQRSFVDSK